ncbi:MAG: hypothetical protein HOP12_07485 [Candidatus Eisenbacteria bacterium]|uniref:Uncharacterized protein n=1 Tax=Eiseniibacteriota bacterium TaxID=2212470 RepID=A0A849SPW4_UNCEI|nr:hypothetical protein [Candidatus Eisenbacteria bacterium]
MHASTERLGQGLLDRRGDAERLRLARHASLRVGDVQQRHEFVVEHANDAQAREQCFATFNLEHVRHEKLEHLIRSLALEVGNEQRKFAPSEQLGEDSEEPAALAGSGPAADGRVHPKQPLRRETDPLPPAAAIRHRREYDLARSG